MKILHIINSLNTGGAEKLLLETIPLYNKKGINVDLLLLNDSESPFLIELKKQKCCNVYSLGKGSVYNPLLIFKIIPYLRKYDVMHVHLFPALYWVAAAKIIGFNKIKIIYTEHNTNNKRRSSIIFKYIDKLFYKPYSTLISISEGVESSLKEHLRIPPAKFQIINNGVNIKSYSEATAYDKSIFFSQNDFILIQISSFSIQKDQQTVIRSLKLLPTNIKLLFVGDGPLKQENEKLVKELQLTERVKFLGIRTDVAELIKTSDICIQSSKWEGFGLVAVESMAAGKPFIASDVSGLNAVVRGAGVLFEQGNYKELANQIIHLSKDKLYCDDVSKRCLERSKKYDIDKMVDKHIKLYKEILYER